LAKKIAVVFDSQSLFSFFMGQEGSAEVQGLLRQIEAGTCEGYINIVNLIELRYVPARAGKDFLEQSITRSGIKIVPLVVGNVLWKIAAELKANYAISLADACAAATAIWFDCELVAGADPEFNQLQDAGLMKILTIGKL